jgi:metal-responsive CopG/Arc/MetJ family transcriptional regulator
VDEKAERERKSRSAVIMAILESFLEQDKKLGEILVDMGVVTQSQLEEALKEQSEGTERKMIGEILVEKGWINDKQVWQALLVQERCKR